MMRGKRTVVAPALAAVAASALEPPTPHDFVKHFVPQMAVGHLEATLHETESGNLLDWVADNERTPGKLKKNK